MAAPAYSYRNTYAPYVPGSAAPERSERSRVRTVPGERPQKQVRSLPSSAGFLAGVIAVALVFVTIVCFARIYLSSEAVTTSIATQKINTELSHARSEGSALEAQTSFAASVSAIADRATAIGMVDPDYEPTIVLDPDVVVTNKDGSLSLSESLRVASAVG